MTTTAEDMTKRQLEDEDIRPILESREQNATPPKEQIDWKSRNETLLPIMGQLQSCGWCAGQRLHKA